MTNVNDSDMTAGKGTDLTIQDYHSPKDIKELTLDKNVSSLLKTYGGISVLRNDTKAVDSTNESAIKDNLGLIVGCIIAFLILVAVGGLICWKW
jgi:hypothetical protein